ncbi:hypothetical protein BG261_00880 [Floricoccus tropicus]|uniref:GmrSD restriction endonucleases N-terminal domain-containing protein n=1 Tax=Floricoccus tropicus TaxID=1859473 RepID=A0A1E8GQE5_9LACT|nr:DUF262 domain-containing protein [Floricoccus tropicus]OFI50464.1 hypothetical protein BG261_00880 [Floricoccus tropicus]
MTTKYNLEKLLKEYKVEIPAIQRDFAFGRKEVKDKREKFVDDLYMAMSRDGINLDFIYGKEENGILTVLDGQQRITILWLFAVYLSKNNSKPDWFSNFTYDTRISSREFCQALISKKWSVNDIDEMSHKMDVKWFYNSWKYDPTISSILSMIKTIDEKKSNYPNLNLSDLNKITFSFLEIDKLGQPEELYLKMNSRGKALTPFENFKADFLEHCKNNLNYNDDELSIISQKIDTTWTDIFWENHSVNHEIDEIYLAFLSRFFLNEWIINSDLSAKQIEDSEIFKKAYSSDSFLSIKNMVTKKSIEKLSNILDNFNSTNLIEFLPKFVSKFHFIPRYNDKKSESDGLISSLTQINRVVFVAISNYLYESKINEESFKRWMRVSCNIIYNADITNVQSMIGAIRLINELSQHSHNIYGFLASNAEIKSSLAVDQVNEEIEKAKAILEDPNLEIKFVKAESIEFFNGRIRDLILDGHWVEININFYNNFHNFISNDENNTFIFRRALLAYNNDENIYPIPSGKVRGRPNNAPDEYLLGGDINARNEWLKIISHDNQKIVDFLKLHANDDKLKQTINNFSDEESKFYKLIKHPNLFGYMDNKNKIFIKDKKVLIETNDRVQAYRYSNCETILLFEKLRDTFQGKGIEGKSFEFYSGDSENRQGVACITLHDEIAIDVKYDESEEKYCLILFNRNPENLSISLNLWNERIPRNNGLKLHENHRYTYKGNENEVVSILDKLIN